MSRFLITSLVVLLFVLPSVASAQSVEINPYIGYHWPTPSSAGQIRDEGHYGLRAGIFLDQNLELEGQFGYLEHFKIREVDARNRGLLWAFGTSYNFSTNEFPFTHKFAPFVIIDVGGITSRTDGYTYAIPGNIPLASGGNIATVRNVQVKNADTFFNVSYGGGLKSIGLWGPMGFRAEVRGRTFPNYYHGAPTWIEGSVGINFVFGPPKPN